MKNLIKEIENLKKGEIGEIVRQRVLEFEKIGSSSEKDVFSELCFCLLTANFQAEKCIKIQKEIGKSKGFEIFSEKELAEKLKKADIDFGHNGPKELFLLVNVKMSYVKISRKKMKSKRVSG